MSNQTTTIQFLKESPKNFIRLTDLSNDSAIGKKDIYLSDIPNENLTQYILSCVGNQDKLIWVEHRQERGNTTVKVAQGYKIEIENQQKPIENIAPVAPVQSQPNFMAAPPTVYPNYPMPIQDFSMLGNPIVKSYIDANEKKYLDLKERHEDLKEEVKDLRSKNRIQDENLSELKIKLSVAEREKEMAVLSEKMNNKSFWDSPAFEKALEKAPDLLTSAMAMKSGQVPAQMQALGSPIGSTPLKKEFFEYADETCNDEQINYLGSVLHHINNDAFKLELNQLIHKYHGSAN